MTDDAVTTFPGVFPRGRIYWFGLWAPDEMKHHFGGANKARAWAVRESLKTSDLREANEKAKALHAHWAERFAELRRQDNPARVEKLAPELVAAVVQSIRRRILAADDTVRFTPGVVGEFLAAWDALAGPVRYLGSTPAHEIPDPVEARFGGMTAAQLQRLKEVHEAIASKASTALSMGRISIAQGYAEDAVAAMGLRVDWQKPEHQMALAQQVMPAVVGAWIARQSRDRGEVIETPAAPERVQLQAKTAEPAGRRMDDALTAWQGLGVRKPKTVSVFRRHVAQYKALTGDPLLAKITKADASKFRADLQRWAVEHEKTKETADNVLATIKALMNVAVGEGEWGIASNVFAGLAVTEGGKQAEQREPWTPGELPRLFASPIFTAYSVPLRDSALNRKAGRDAAYWVPLLCLYSGARPGEVCQLWTDDLSEVEDSEGRPVLVLEFRANRDRGQTLKNPSSWRALPIHSELLRLGLRAYWQAVSERHGAPGPLFPAIPKTGANGPGGQFGQWFGEFKKAQGFGLRTTLHSFRHTAETELAFAEVPPTLVDAITGHEGQGIGRKQYGATIRRNAVRLRPSLEKLTFPMLNLPRVFTAPAWTPENSKDTARTKRRP